MTRPKELPRVMLGHRPDVAGGEPTPKVVEIRTPGSVITFAPLGSRKDTGLVLPNLRVVESSIVITDLDGAYYTATADYRRSMGQRVIRLDPFRLIDEQTDAIDPYGLLDLPGEDHSAACLAIANLMFPRTSMRNNSDVLGYELLGAVLGYCAAVPEKRSLASAVRVFFSDDVVYNLAVVLDTIGGKLRKEVYSAIASFLQHEDSSRSQILQAVQTRLAPLNDLSESSLATFSPPTLPLAELVTGETFTIYLILPRVRLRSHAILLRLWIGTLLQAVAHPSTRAPAAVFVLDEPQELQFPDLEAATTLRWPSNALLWSLWQSPGQLRLRHPDGWFSMIENCVALQALAPIGFAIDEEVDALFRVEPGTAARLSEPEQLLRQGSELMKLHTLAM